MILQKRYTNTRKIGFNVIIRMKYMDIFSLCNLKTQITILKLTQIPRIFHVFQSGIIKRCNDFIGIIRRTIIHNNNFDMRVGLIQCTFNSPIHHICPIICWYANRDKCSIIHVNINLSSIIASLGQKVFSYLEYRIHLSGEGFVCFIIRLHFLRKRGQFQIIKAVCCVIEMYIPCSTQLISCI